MAWPSLVFLLALLAVCVLPVVYLFDALSVAIAAGLAGISMLVLLARPDPLTLGLALGPLAVYFLLLATLNFTRRPRLVSGAKDLAALAVAVAGLMAVGPMELFFPLTAAIRFDARGMGYLVWVLLAGLYALVVALVLLTVRPRLAIYNISAAELRPILAAVAAKLDRDARWAGEGLALPNLGVQLHVDCVSALRSAALISSGPAQDMQGWRKLENALATALAETTVPRNRRAAAFLSAALAIALLVAAAAFNP